MPSRLPSGPVGGTLVHLLTAVIGTGPTERGGAAIRSAFWGSADLLGTPIQRKFRDRW